MVGTVLTSLAILKVNWDKGKDYIDNFVPIIAECLRTIGPKAISVDELQGCVQREFGLRLPQGALQTVLKRAVKHGYVCREDKLYVRNDAKLRDSHFAEIRSTVLHQHDALVQRILTFCTERFGVDVTPETADSALHAYLQLHSADSLLPALKREPVTCPPPTSVSKEMSYLINAFIAQLPEKDPETFMFLTTILKGRMLADALYFPQLATVQRHFDDVKVYVDTTVLLRALGCSGPSLQTPYAELFELLRIEGASMWCFEHTYDEILGVLKGDAERLRDPNMTGTHGETLKHFLTTGVSASDLQLRIAGLRKELADSGVQVVPKPIYERALGINEVRLQQAIWDEVHYRNRLAWFRDVDSLTAIYRLRRGELHRPLESCGAVFVTSNSTLAWASSRFYRDEYGREITPICLPADVLTTIVWLKRPALSPDLPEKRIVADCYAAMNPDDELWMKYIAEIERLRRANKVSTEDYFVLRSSYEARHALMDVTLGCAEVFTEGSVEEILDRARRAMIAEERERTERAEERARDAEQRLAKAEQTRLQEAVAHEKGLQQAGRRVARALTWLVFAGGTLVLAVGAWLSLPKPLAEFAEAWPRTVVAGLLVVANLASLLNLLIGKLVLRLTRRLVLLRYV